jgi:hypothetical protein
VLVLTTEQKEEYGELKEEVRPYLRFITWHKRLSRYGLAFISLLFVLFVITSIILNIQDAMYLFFIFYSFGLIILIVDWALLKLSNRAGAKTDTIAKYLVYSIIDNIDRFFDPNKAGTAKKKTKYRKIAIQRSTTLLVLIQDKWKVGSYGLAENLLKKPVENFENLISNRLIPAITCGDADTLLKKANDILFQISFLLNQPTVDELIRINEKITAELPDKTKIGGKPTFTTYFNSNNMFRHFISNLAIVGASVLIFFLSKSFSATDFQALELSAPIWAVLTAGYFIFLKKS